MINLIKLNDNLAIDLSKTNENILFRLLYFLNYLKKYEFIPKFKYIKFKKILIIKSNCKIIFNLKNDAIWKLKKMYKIIENKNIKLNLIYDKIPLLQNTISKQIYFLNFFFSSHCSLNKFNIEPKNKLFLLKNKFILNKYLLKNYNMHLEPIKNINFFIVIYGIFNLEKIVCKINSFKNLRIKITFILFIIEKDCYNLINLIEKDIFNKYILIKLDKYIEKSVNTLKYLKDIIELNYDYIILLNIKSNILFNKYILNIKGQKNIIYTLNSNKCKNNRCKNINIFIQQNYKLNNILKGKQKSINEYTKLDIDYNNIKFNNNLISKNFFLKNYGKIDFQYNFKDKLYPNYIPLEKSLFNKNIFNFIINIAELINEENFNNFIGLYIFYNNIKLHYL